MKQTISKCDRCGRKTDNLIDLRLINQNTEAETSYQEKEYSSFSLFLGQRPKDYPTINVELCEICTKTLLHWLAHSENFLRPIKKQITKIP